VQSTDAGLYTAVVTVVTNVPVAPAGFSAALTVQVPLALSQPQILPNGDFQMLLQGPAEGSYEIEISSNLVNWSFLKAVNYTSGQMPVVDSTAGAVTQRFYRAKPVP
jgi:hypothetical protein